MGTPGARYLATFLRLGLATTVVGLQPPAPLAVHEWGTITTRHAPDGTPDGRLNRIDSVDVLPSFVHRYEPPVTRGDSSLTLGKGPLVPGRPDVTMRLETPVIYFHPARGARVPAFNVNVRFRGGVLNEFYPDARGSLDVDMDRVRDKMERGVIRQWDGKVLDNYVVGGLGWTGIALRDSVPVPHTDHHAWITPRRVRSSAIATPKGEGERYLFYRGVAHLDAPIQTRTLASEVVLRAPERMLWLGGEHAAIAKLWLVDVRAGGSSAFRELDRIVLSKSNTGAELARVPLFSDGDHSVEALARLRASMKRALTDAGLFDDEAEAMLDTWRESYFRNPGLRVFYLVPTEWVDYHLPLRISVPNVLTRVLVGRIDLRR
jgi:hypothetical protein